MLSCRQKPVTNAN